MINAKLKDNQRLATKSNLSRQLLRQKRAIAFQAFDIYKTNVQYGIVTETPEDHAAITEWYSRCLDMEHPGVAADALLNIPEAIGRYMRTRY